MLIADLRTEVATLLRERIPNLRLALVFGSHARGDATAASDVDVAFDAGAPLDAALVAEARAALECALVRDVHLIDLAAARTVLRHEVVRTG